MTPPCATCSTSPCCTLLPLHTFKVNNVQDFSYTGYLLNFDRIRLGVNRDFEWSAYYSYPCRHLDRESFGCSVHGTPLQPNICVSYSPYTCWYRRKTTVMTTPDLVFVDRSRLAYISEHVRFNELRDITVRPEWEAMIEAFGDLSDPPQESPDPPLADPVYDAWADMVLRPGATSPLAQQPANRTYEESTSPCDGCSAPCCETLGFPQEQPTTAHSFDFFRFALGFPGVELTVRDSGSWLTVKTRCRHLLDGRCGVYGRPERPIVCTYYDAWKCTYRVEFGTPRPAGALRVRYENLPALLDAVTFDEHGALQAMPPVDEMRTTFEANWRESAAASLGDIGPAIAARPSPQAPSSRPENG